MHSISGTISLDKIFQDLRYAILLTDRNMNILAANENFAAFYGLQLGSVIGKNIKVLYPDFENSVFYEAFAEVLTTGKESLRIGYSNNTKKWFSAKAIPYQENQFLVLINALSEHDKKFDFLQSDNLTSLKNRFMLEDDLEKTYRKNKDFTLFLIDLLKFRSINESFGVSQGDMLLMEFAARLKSHLGKNVSIYRYNADQFAVVANTIISVEINRIITSIQETKINHFMAQSNQIHMDLAIGYCSIKKFENSFQEVITHAEIALSKAKKTKSKTAVEFNEKENTLQNKHKVILANELKKALKENSGLVLYYQRQVDCVENKICGAETLVRWEHPTQGFISPAQFLPVAEEFDLMFDLDKFVFLKAVKELYELMRRGIELPISINLSSASLCNPKIVDLVQNVLKRINIDPGLITVEITESAFIEEKQISRKIVEELKSLGLNIALDDFCTGYSSMEYLLSYPADYLKIDKEFIRKIDEDSQRKKIVKGLITMAQSLNMSVIAEGVETKEEAMALMSMNCNCIQGYYFGKPQKLEDLTRDIDKLGYTTNKGQLVIEHGPTL